MQIGREWQSKVTLLSYVRDSFRYGQVRMRSGHYMQLRARHNHGSRPRPTRPHDISKPYPVRPELSKHILDNTLFGCSLHSRRMSSLIYSFPWCQKIEKSKEDPIHHKLVGLFLLKRVLRNYAREEFDVGEFVNGVKQAIQVLAECIRNQDKENRLARILGNELHARFYQAFSCMKMEKKRVFLEVEALQDVRMSGVRAVCGNAEEGDDYVISFLGQRIITSKRDMFELEKRVDSTGYSSLFKYGKEMGISAAQKQLRFQIDIQFTSNERFYVEQKSDDNWEVVFGETDLVTSQHKLRFESFLDDHEEAIDKYPLSWKIVNIDFDEDVLNDEMME